MKIALLTIILLTSGGLSSTASEYQRGFSSLRTCTRNEYMEEYIPGTRNNPGYVKSWEETVEVPCEKKESNNNTSKLDNNDCSEGSIAGAILGGGIATAISRGKDRWWVIPAGVVGGSMFGCQIDGG